MGGSFVDFLCTHYGVRMLSHYAYDYILSLYLYTAGHRPPAIPTMIYQIKIINNLRLLHNPQCNL